MSLKDRDFLKPYRSSQTVSILIGNLLVAFMMASVAVGFVQVGKLVNENWNGSYLVWMALLLSLEAAYTKRSTRDLDFREKVLFRISEWVAFAILIKLLIYLLHGFNLILLDLPRWEENLSSFFTPEYMLALLVALITWSASGAFAGELDELHDRERDAAWDELGKLQNALQDIRKRIIGRVFLLGGLVVLLAILSRLSATALLRLGGLTSPGYKAPVANVLVYFILAMILLSLTQLAMLRTRWLWQGLPISTKISGNWLKWSLIFFAVLAVIVFFLPTEYSLGLFDTLRVVVNIVIQLVTLLLILLTIPFGLCLSLFSLASGPQTQQTPQILNNPPIEVHGTPVTWLETLRSIAFWAIFVAIIFFAFRYYLRQNTSLWQSLQRLPVIRWLGQAWQVLRDWIRGVNRQVSQLVNDSIQRLRTQRPSLSTQRLRKIMHTRSLSSREKVILFYLNLVELGSERGLARRPNQTPHQYEQRLSEALPEMEPELNSLTDTFIEARYSQHAVEDSTAQQAGSLWEQIKDILRNWRKSA